MKKNAKQRKLQLSRETLCQLADKGLENAAGGTFTFLSWCACGDASVQVACHTE